MNYIEKISVDKIEILNSIIKSDLKIKVLNINFESFQKIFSNEIKELNISKIINFLDSLKKNVNNAEDLIIYFKSNIAGVVTNFVINNNIYEEDLSDEVRSVIESDFYQILNYSKFMKKPMKNWKQIFINFIKKIKDVKKDPSVKYDSQKFFVSEMIKKIILPYYKDKNPDDYLEIILDGIDSDDIIELLPNSLHNISDILIELYSYNFPKNLIIRFMSDINNSSLYLEKILFPYLKTTIIDDDKIYNSFIDEGGDNRFIYDLIIKKQLAKTALKFVMLTKIRPPIELEKIILKTATTARIYVKLGYDLKEDDTFFNKLFKNPTATYKHLKSNYKGRPKDRRFEEAVLSGEDSLAFDYFKHILKSNWTGNEDIKDRIENKIINTSNYTKKRYLKEIIDKIPKKNRNSQYIMNFINNDNKLSIIKETILTSDSLVDLIDFSFITMTRLNSDLESYIRNYNIYSWIRYCDFFNIPTV